MTYKVLVVLSKKKNGDSSIITFTKEIGAANEEQACRFAIQALEGFLAEGVVVHAEVITDEEDE